MEVALPIFAPPLVIGAPIIFLAFSSSLALFLFLTFNSGIVPVILPAILPLLFFIITGLPVFGLLLILSLPLFFVSFIFIGGGSVVLKLIIKISLLIFVAIKTFFKFIGAIFFLLVRIGLKIVEKVVKPPFLIITIGVPFIAISPVILLLLFGPLLLVLMLTSEAPVILPAVASFLVLFIFSLIGSVVLPLLLPLLFFVITGLVFISIVIMLLPFTLFVPIIFIGGNFVMFKSALKIAFMIFEEVKTFLKVIATISVRFTWKTFKIILRLAPFILITTFLLPFIIISPVVLFVFGPAVFVSLSTSGAALLFTLMNIVWFKISSNIIFKLGPIIAEGLRAGFQIMFFPIRFIIGAIAVMLTKIFPIGPAVLIFLLPVTEVLFGFVLGPVVDLLVTLLGPLSLAFLPIEPILIFLLAVIGLLLSPLSPISFLLSPVTLPILLIIVLLFTPLLFPAALVLKPFVFLATAFVAPVFYVGIKFFVPGTTGLIKFLMPVLYGISNFFSTIMCQLTPLLLPIVLLAGALLFQLFENLKTAKKILI